jgi:hypothetical protein
MRILISVFFLAFMAAAGYAQDLRAPADVNAGSAFSIASTGSGQGTFYLIGPGQVSKRSVDLGDRIAIHGNEVRHAGRYTAILCASDCNTTHFFVHALKPTRLRFLVHPSRVEIGRQNAISAVAFVFDKYLNLAFAPGSVEFHIRPQGGQEISASRPTENGHAWVELASANKQGVTSVGVTVADDTEFRVVQQVAADACNLRIQAAWVKNQLLVQTDPVRDCHGNAVPDGTVVTFTKIDSSGKTTVDAPIKRDVAQVEMPVSGAARITAASGTVTGNELQVSGRAQ